MMVPKSWSKVKDRVHFLWQGIRRFREVGAVTYSSEALCRRACQWMEAGSPDFVVELGGGDGVMTRYILDRLPEDGLLLSFEINEHLFQKLSEIKDPRLVPIHDSAEYIEQYILSHGRGRPQGIISAIPFLVLPPDLSKTILEACYRALPLGGIFSQVHFSKKLVSLYEGIFGNCTIFRVFNNIPPAYIFQCEKPANGQLSK